MIRAMMILMMEVMAKTLTPSLPLVER